MLYFYIETDDYTLLACYLERNNYTMFVVLQELGIDKNLYALVFGESVLNDVVCRDFSLLNILWLKLIN